MTYPRIGSPVVPVGHDALCIMFDTVGPNTINVGQLQQDASIGAYIDVDDLVSKHFAIFGSTGAGKSSAVSVLLHEIMDARQSLRILLIDPHNEYAGCFEDRAHVVRPGNLRLPYWLFNFDEMQEIVFGRRSDIEDEVGLLAELIPLAKNEYAKKSATNPTGYRNLSNEVGGRYTVDTPVPYRMNELVAIAEARMGKLENGAVAGQYRRLISRLQSVRKNPRYSFIFDDDAVGNDTMVDILCELLRLEGDGSPMTIVQLAGFPAEVFDAIVSVLFRMAFEFGLWSDGALPLLIVCEEAHNYANADRSIGFRPAREAVSRIAKEGRKYGVFLGLVTQRPAQIDPTLVSQCRPCSRCGSRTRKTSASCMPRCPIRATGCSASWRRSAPARRSRSAPAFRSPRGCASRNCPRTRSRPRKRCGADASTPARRSTAIWSRTWWRAGAASR
jgi:DNA helicase HerA-like ATPase